MALKASGLRGNMWCTFPADYLTKVVVSGKKSSDLKVSEIMTKEEVLKTVSPSGAVAQCQYCSVVTSATRIMCPGSFTRPSCYNVTSRLLNRCPLCRHGAGGDGAHDRLQLPTCSCGEPFEVVHPCMLVNLPFNPHWRFYVDPDVSLA